MKPEKPSFVILFDDGGVLNDNSIREPQWKALCGKFFSSQFGGDSNEWAEANRKVMKLLDIDILNPKDGFWQVSDDYLTFYAKYKSEWVIRMFEAVGRAAPPKEKHEQIFNSVIEYVWPKVESTIPGIIESIKFLHSKGFALYTSTGLPSKDIELVLQGMGIKECFSGFYGPDLINTRKLSTSFFEVLFNDINLESKKAIVIEDRPIFIENALNTGANVIQACITGEFPPQYPYYVENMYDLPKIIEDLIRDLK